MGSIDPLRGAANALSLPPGKYDRKIKTQRNRREFAQAVDHVVQFDTERKTSPGLEIQLHASRKGGSLRGCWTGDARLKLSAIERVISRKKFQLITVKPDPLHAIMGRWAIPWEVPPKRDPVETRSDIHCRSL
ncbi:hypothetical protein A2690_01065 [Candidatus Roizmanbacteria bacterium RIFCSPHIGHO2_01_FULL_39_12b]|uniref:Uncharacterized protein n=1 Tax=Candidatus Roizmanbacteria bacterium RIFCSPHIGHO2_01_FULL_39_12b TaxID=1802030 RepID=A0A1F7GE21_9BACT|nr:MAG: hypothetical protein A2690_01065 [Candidatus Roizmanbacteria bacterium RIFCSPHIGHO2_01_FULL_39_12b]